MRTRSSSHLIVESSTTPKRRNRRRSKQRVEPFSLEETSVVTMADQRTMAELLQAPTEGYGDAIVTPAILAENFELKHGLLNLVTSKQFYGFEKEDPHAHIRPNRILLHRVIDELSYKVGKFHFPADFLVVDYVFDPRVPLILRRPFLRTARALIDVYGEELTLRVDDEAINPFNSSTSGNPTSSLDPILSTSFPSLTPFEGGDFILEEIEACLSNDSIPPGIDDADFDPEGDLLLL
ncbi:reverse transcriptase domain-containing protein [Tanacetum coccineum]